MTGEKDQISFLMSFPTVHVEKKAAINTFLVFILDGYERDTL